MVGQQKTQRRLRQWIDILRCQTAVAYHYVPAISDEFDRTRIVVFEAYLAGLGNIEIALRAAAVGTDLDEFARQVLHGGEIIIDALDDAALLGSKRASFA